MVKKAYLYIHWYAVYSSSSSGIADSLLEMERHLSNVLNVWGPDKYAVKGYLVNVVGMKQDLTSYI
jgi:hypothetical protein